MTTPAFFLAIGGAIPKTRSGSKQRCVPGSPHAGYPGPSIWTTGALWRRNSSCEHARRSGSASRTRHHAGPQGRGKIERFFRTVRDQFEDRDRDEPAGRSRRVEPPVHRVGRRRLSPSCPHRNRSSTARPVRHLDRSIPDTGRASRSVLLVRVAGRDESRDGVVVLEQLRGRRRRSPVNASSWCSIRSTSPISTSDISNGRWAKPSSTRSDVTPTPAHDPTLSKHQSYRPGSITCGSSKPNATTTSPTAAGIGFHQLTLPDELLPKPKPTTDSKDNPS